MTNQTRNTNRVKAEAAQVAAQAEAKAKAAQAKRAEAEAVKAGTAEAAQAAEAAKAEAAQAEAEAAEALSRAKLARAEARAEAAERARIARAEAEAKAEAEAVKDLSAQAQAVYLKLQAKEAETNAKEAQATEARWSKETAKDERTKRKMLDAVRMPQLSEAAEAVAEALRHNEGILTLSLKFAKYRFTVTDIALCNSGNIQIAFKLASGKKAKDSKDWTYSQTALSTFHFTFHVQQLTRTNGRGQTVCDGFRISHSEQIHKITFETDKLSGEAEALANLHKLVKLETEGKEFNRVNSDKRKFYLDFFGAKSLKAALDAIQAAQAAEAEAAQAAETEAAQA